MNFLFNFVYTLFIPRLYCEWILGHAFNWIVRRHSLSPPLNVWSIIYWRLSFSIEMVCKAMSTLICISISSSLFGATIHYTIDYSLRALQFITSDGQYWWWLRNSTAKGIQSLMLLSWKCWHWRTCSASERNVNKNY